MTDASNGALDGLRILDLSRILAGPTCTQLLGDLGADVIKIENPATKGDDTRAWGPPFAKNTDGSNSDLSSYFMSANRNKRSVAIDITTTEGQAQIKALAADADVLIENFKAGGLAKYGLDYASLEADCPGLVYCSITGFGQTGPNKDKPGYDLMAQGYGGIMSLTGEVDGAPMKVGVGIADVMCGMYATVGILAALRHRDETGEGQYIDLALVDTQMAWLINEGVGHLTTRQPRPRRGNAHPTIVPYQTFEASDGHLLIAVGNDSQFERFCAFLNLEVLSRDPRFATNPARLDNREELIPLLETILRTKTRAEIISGLEEAGVPVGPIHTVEEALASDQADKRWMVVGMPAEGIDRAGVELLGNPLKFSKTPVTYRKAPPRFGQDTDEILAELAAKAPKA